MGNPVSSAGAPNLTPSPARYEGTRPSSANPWITATAAVSVLLLVIGLVMAFATGDAPADTTAPTDMTDLDSSVTDAMQAATRLLKIRVTGFVLTVIGALGCIASMLTAGLVREVRRLR